MGDKNQSPTFSKSNRTEPDYGGAKRRDSHGKPVNPRNKRRRKTNKKGGGGGGGGEQTLKVEEDRISELPDSVLLQILSLLPAVNQVIRTGILSKRWLNLWTFVPNLVFTLPFGETRPTKFVSDVNRTLFQSRVSKVERFSIIIPYHTSFSPDVDSWVQFATTNNVDYLTLSFITLVPWNFYVLPQHLYTRSSLKIMELSNCIIAPSGLISWKLLKSLSLYDVRLSDAVMDGIFSGCPVLEIFRVYCYYGVNRVNVTSPSLRELVLSGYEHHFDEDDDDAFLAISAPRLCTMTIAACFYTWNIRLEDVTSLDTADLSFSLDIDDDDDTVEDYDKYLDLVQELIGKLHHVKELKLATWCIQVLSVLEVQGMPSPFLNCKSLTLDMHIADCDLPGIAKVLDISPYLETLVISTETLYPSEFFVGDVLFGAYSFDGENYFESRKTIPECLSLHLKKVKIFGFRSRRWEVLLVQFLLKNAKVLETMDIYLQREDFKCQSECCVWREIVDELNLPVSSPHGIVRFFESPEEFVEALKLEKMLTRV